MSRLSHQLAGRVLARLGFSEEPSRDVPGLQALYGAWCRHVPFDNVRKLIERPSGSPFPGTTAEDFFEAWLNHGTGGTCWPGAGAFHALLAHLGFESSLCVATMLVAPDLPPNHGSVVTKIGGDVWLTDCSMLHGEPLRMDESAVTEIAHPAWGVSCVRRDGRWHVAWRPLHKPDGFDCRFERFDATPAEYADRYEATRAWSPFNWELSARINRGDRVIGAAFGKLVTIEVDGRVSSIDATHEDRARFLVEDFGMSEEMVARLPVDVPTPPPPGR